MMLAGQARVAARAVTTTGQAGASSGSVWVSLSPSAPTVARNDIVVLEIRLTAGAQSVDGAEAHLYYDPLYLLPVDAGGNPTDRITSSGALSQILRNKIYTDTGHIHFAAGIYDPEEPRPSGTFTLATVRFRALWGTGAGSTPLLFGTVLPFKTDVTNAGSSVLGGVENGVITITGEEPPLPATPTLTATPTETPTPTISPTPSATAQCTPMTLSFQAGNLPEPSYYGVVDTFLSIDAPTVAQDGNTTMQMKNDANGGKRPLIRFDISRIPEGSRIDGATLYLAQDAYRKNDLFVSTVSIYQMLRQWTASQATWLQATSVVPWSVSGADGAADRVLTPLSSQVIGAIPAWQWRAFAVKDAVQAWVSNPGSNAGLLLIGEGSSQEFHFYSSNYPPAAYRPRLEVTYCAAPAVPTITPTATNSPTISPTPTQTQIGAPTSTRTPTPTATAIPTATPTATPEAAILSVEAELGRITAPMAVVLDATASNGAYVASPISYEGYVDLNYYITVQDNYELWGRIAADSVGSDSFWVTVDNGDQGRWDLPLGPWRWTFVAFGGAGQPRAELFFLEVGWHRVRIWTREHDARLDRLEFRLAGSHQDATPTYIATPSPTASATSTATPTSSSTPTASATATATPTATASPTPTSTPSPTATQTATHTLTATATQTATPTLTATQTQTPGPTPTATETPQSYVVLLPLVIKMPPESGGQGGFVSAGSR